MNGSINKKDIVSALKKSLDNKKSVLAYLNGKLTKEDLTKKGIKIGSPI